MKPALFTMAATILLSGCTLDHTCTDPQVTVTQWDGTPGMGVQWDDLDGSFPTIEGLVDAAIEGGGNSTGVVSGDEYDRFEAAMDSAWEETGRPGARPNTANIDVVEYQAVEWALHDERICE